MPLFEYQCRRCEHRFELLVLHSSPVPECPLCHKQELEQLLSTFAASSESIRQASLGAAHAKAATVRGERHRQEHVHLHEHFEDTPTTRTTGATKSQD
ncbi:MAG TPA: FmdB family zinc ribbon protein [Bryobacteraceae bacterium]|jgi:putative FmdB family regulatory protein